MKFKDIDFGKVDAKNEFDANSKSDEKNFEQAYILPDNVDIGTLINGGKSYVYGMKGTGKTALLKYLEIVINKKENSCTDFILFKTRFGEEERKTFNYQATTVVDKDQITDSGEIKDYEIVWRWFFYNYIIDYISKTGATIVEFDSNWYSFYNTVMSARNEKEVGLKRYFPKIKKGNIKINIEIIKADAEWHNKSQDIKFSELIAKADKHFDNIKFDNNERLYILLDELELDYSNKNVYGRDVRLIRDLIIFTDKFNHKCVTREIPIKIITSVRMEVLTAIQSVGKEINKIIEDNGVQISWHQSGGNE